VPWKDSKSHTIYVILRMIHMTSDGTATADTTSRFVVPRCHELAGFYWQYMAPEEKRILKKEDDTNWNWQRFLKILGELWHYPETGKRTEAPPAPDQPVIETVHTRGGPRSALRLPEVMCEDCKGHRTRIKCIAPACTLLICGGCAQHHPWCTECTAKNKAKAAAEQAEDASAGLHAPGLVNTHNKRRRERRIALGRKSRK